MRYRSLRLLRPTVSFARSRRALPRDAILVAHPTHFILNRGAKTSATVQFATLPQGPLPQVQLPEQLPELEDDAAPGYSTVLRQHLNHVKQYSDCVVLTRVGNFYELYGEQAEEYAPLLGLKLAQRRAKKNENTVAMAGFQFVFLDRYLKMLVQDQNKQVAIAEEVRLSEADQVKAGGLLYTRKVSRVITAGTLIDENFMDPYENNFLLSIHMSADNVSAILNTEAASPAAFQRKLPVGLAWVDLSSGALFTQQTDMSALESIIARIGPREIVLDSSLQDLATKSLGDLFGQVHSSLAFHSNGERGRSLEQWLPMLEKPIPQAELHKFTAEEVTAGNLLLSYVKEKLMDLNISLQCPVRRSELEYMSIDRHTLRGLEIRATLREGAFQGSLSHATRRTVTTSGTRLLNQRLVSPSMDLKIINDRLELVEQLLNAKIVRSDVIALLRRSSDSMRLLQRFAIGKGDADDLLALAKTMNVTREIYGTLASHSKNLEGPDIDSHTMINGDSMSNLLQRFDFDGPDRLSKRISDAIDEDSLSQQHEMEEKEAAAIAGIAKRLTADIEDQDGLKKNASGVKMPSAVPITAGDDEGDIWIMRKSASETLRRTHSELANIIKEKQELAIHLREEHGTNSLSLKWTPQLGHFCHVKGKDARTDIAGARSIGSTKSTKSFYLTDWTKLGTRLDNAKLRIRTEEQRVFNRLRGEVINNMVKLRRNAGLLDELDVACSSATLAEEKHLVKPILHSGKTTKIIAGRHPMVDDGLRKNGRLFTANDCTVGGNENILLITGPNMAGKSTFLRQNALISILAQTGSFVPAAYAEIGLVDKLFSRIGSADDVYNHQSTFMVEMLEVAEILNQATDRSFVIMDEVGRGTTPDDGVAVGFACLHHLHYENKCRSLFATHFHKLIDMAEGFDKLACYCTNVADHADGSWIYVHKLRRGVNRDSHALKVAKLAGLPQGAIDVAARVIEDMKVG